MTLYFHDHGRGRTGAIGVALTLDAVFRELPLAVHPVRWMGRYLRAAGRHVPAEPPRRAATTGGLAWAAGAALATGAGAAAHRLAPDTRWLRSVALGTALWPLLSLRMLTDEVDGVERALAADIEAGRTAVSRIVSRDITTLDESQVRQAAIESLAENLSDSVVAPLFWFAVGGLPAAAAYRFANTADAVWGYRNARWEHAGKVAARADDLFNLLPSRLTGLALAGRKVPMRQLRRAARTTASPNAGWPMAAIALRLGIRLEKSGAYELNPGGQQPTSGDATTAVRRARYVGLTTAAVAAARFALASIPLPRDRWTPTDAVATPAFQRSPRGRRRWPR